ncbi:MAG: carbon-nitrogen hydrolase family protein [Bacteroidetes bacterium]|nr:carbon-nitrogen hydrolase family protein [Bacteroidota bacterium]
MVKIGMAQILVEGCEPYRNFERAEKLVAEAAEVNCDIVLLPETIDFAWTHPSALTDARPIPGEFSDIFCDMAKKYKIYLCVGLTEKVTEEKRFNTALLINSDGEIILKYHKINLLEVEFPFYSIGDKLGVVDTPFGKIGVNICADNYQKGLHIGHTLARMGARIILSPSSWTVDFSVTEEDEPYADKWVKPLKILASWHDMIVISTTSDGYIVGGPYEGKKKVGKSLAVGKEGVLMEGVFNEFAGELNIVEVEVPTKNIKGVEIGEDMEKKGYQFDVLPGK